MGEPIQPIRPAPFYTRFERGGQVREAYSQEEADRLLADWSYGSPSPYAPVVIGLRLAAAAAVLRR